MREENKEGFLECGCGCCGGHGHQEYGDNSQKQRGFFANYWIDFFRIGLSLALFLVGFFIINNHILKLAFYIVSAFIVGYGLVVNFIKNILRFQFFDENFLMLLASVVAFILGEGFEGFLIVWLFFVGELFEHIATDNAKNKLAGLSELQIDTVHLITANGTVDIEPESVEIGSLIQVKHGERVPIDSVLLERFGEFDLRAISGESKICQIGSGKEVLSGAINVGDTVVLRTVKLYKESTVEKIISMVKDSTAQKSRSQKFISYFAKVYTPIIVVLAILIGGLVPVFDGFAFAKWIYRALNFLVISCPCALVISVPLAFFVGIGGLARRGILVKGSSFIDVLSEINCIVFDKTGTITEGNLRVESVEVYSNFTCEELIKLVVDAEANSTHPIAKAIVEYAKGFNIYAEKISVKEIAGKGLSYEINGKNILIGNSRLIEGGNIEKIDDSERLTSVYVWENNFLIGVIRLSDNIKAGIGKTIEMLKKNGVKTVMMSGDNYEAVSYVAKKIGVDEFHSGLLPQEKAEKLSEIKKQYKKVAFVGDGINDSPVLAGADVGIAMGKMGSHLAVDSADIVLMDDDVSKIPAVIKSSKKIIKIVRQNIAISLLVKFAIMCASFVVGVPIYLSVFADVGVMILAILNSLRASK